MSVLLVSVKSKTMTKDKLMQILSRKKKIINVQFVSSINKEICHCALITFQTKEEAESALDYLNNDVLSSFLVKIEQFYKKSAIGVSQFTQTFPLNSTDSSKCLKDTAIELTPEMVAEVKLLCKNMIEEYEQTQNLDESVIHLKRGEFVKSILIISLERFSSASVNAGTFFAELLSKNIISIEAVTQAFDEVLKDWKDYLLEYPYFFSYMSTSIASLFVSKNASFNFINLKDACKSMCPSNSFTFFIEILQNILLVEEIKNLKKTEGILLMYNKWIMSEYIPLSTFIPCNNKINTYFKNNRIGIFLLSIAMYDEMKLIDKKSLYDTMCDWINTNIQVEIIILPQFIRALTIAIIILSLKCNYSTNDFFNYIHGKLLAFYIHSKPLPELDIQERELQCLYGIQIISASLKNPGNMLLKLFNKLYVENIVSLESFEKWKKEDEAKVEFIEDKRTKDMTVEILNSFFLSISLNDSDE